MPDERGLGAGCKYSPEDALIGLAEVINLELLKGELLIISSCP